MTELVVGLSRERIDERKLAAFVAEGGKRATAFVKEVVESHKHHGRKYTFDENFVVEINKRVMWYAHPDVRGELRTVDDDGTEVDTELVVSGREARMRFPLFGRWLDEATRSIWENPEGLQEALQIAAAAHYGLTGPQLHPFIDGNGRTARALVNAILMSGSKELIEYGIAIPPVPLMRQVIKEKGRVDPYINALRNVRKQKVLNPLEVFIAEKWAGNLNQMLATIKGKIHKPTKTDLGLINKFEWRRSSLRQFIDRESAGQNSQHMIPDYFALRHIRI